MDEFAQLDQLDQIDQIDDMDEREQEDNGDILNSINVAANVRRKQSNKRVVKTAYIRVNIEI